MRILRSDHFSQKEILFRQLGGWLKEGQLLALPSDTLVGLSVDATNPKALERVQTFKSSQGPFSLVVPDQGWLGKLVHPDQLELALNHRELYLREHTLVYKAHPHCPLDDCLHRGGTIAIRRTGNWLQGLADQCQIPLTSTSLNQHQAPPLQEPKELSPKQTQQIDLFVEEVEENALKENASHVLDFSQNEEGIKIR